MTNDYNVKAIGILKTAVDKGYIITFKNGVLNVHVEENRDIDDIFLNELRENKEYLITYFERKQLRKDSDNNIFSLGNNQNLTEFPLSFFQEGFWFIDKMEGGNLYNLSAMFSVEGDLNIDIANQAFSKILKRHEILRCIYIEKSGIALQKVINEEDWRIFEYDFLDKDKDKIDRLIQSELCHSFKLDREYVLRVSLVRVNNSLDKLLVVLHHIAADGWSIEILIKEFTMFYNAILFNTKEDLEPLNFQYKNYALWQHKLFKSNVWDNTLQLWKSDLKSVSTLSFDHFSSDKINKLGNVKALNFSFEEDLISDIKLFSKTQNISEYIIFLASLKILLYKYTGESDICIGSPMANRGQKEFENLIGLFTNTLPIRSILDYKQSVLDYLKSLKSIYFEVFDRQEIPLEKIVSEVCSKRDPNIHPLFQVLYVYEKKSDQKIRIGNAILTSIEVENDTNKFDLTFCITEGAKINYKIEFNSKKIDIGIAREMGRLYHDIIRSMISSPNIDIKSLDIGTKNTFISQDINCKKKLENLDSTIVEMFEEQVDYHFDKVAVVFEDKTYSYDQLDQRSNQLAHYLCRLNVKSEVLVGVCMERSLELIPSLMGILKAGGAYLPIDPDYPIDRIQYMVGDSKLQLVLTTSKYSHYFEGIGIEVVLLDQLDLGGMPTQRMNNELKNNDLFYVIYTSGSTGRPKGVANHHEGVINRLLWAKEYFEVDPSDRILQKTTISFDVSVWELFLPLISGACVVLAEPGGHRDSSYLVNTINKQGITMAHFVPSMLEVFLQDQDLNKMDSLRHVICSGEELKVRQAKLFRERLGDIRLYNLYGPTEAAIDVTFWEVPFPFPEDQRVIPIGYPIPNNKIYILDTRDNLVPIGVKGEIFIGGIQIARGYINQSELTSERFVEKNIAGQKLRLYRSGDIGRWLEDGVIEFIGRADDQVKIRGNRVELNEVESVLAIQPGVGQCTIQPKEDPSGGIALIGYVVPQKGYDRNFVEKSLREKLPGYMVPSLFVEIENLPYTDNGKIDKLRLPFPSGGDFSSSVFESPGNEIEERLCEIWKNLLGIDKISIHDDFFELGGHSLMAIRIINSIKEILGKSISVKDLFYHPTISSLAKKISINESSAYQVIIGEKVERIPLSFAQERLWFINKKEGSIAYHLPALFKINGDLDIRALEESFVDILNRHQILRTIYIEENDGSVYQKVLPVEDWKLNIEYDLKISLTKYAELQVEKPFNLERDYMVKALLINKSSQENYLLVIFHHIAIDGWSIPILFEEVLSLYKSKVENFEEDIKPLNAQYSDFVIWEKNKVREQEIEQKLNYWEEKLKYLDTPKLLSDFRIEKQSKKNGAFKQFKLNKTLTEKLYELSKSLGVSNYTTLLTVFKILIYKYTGNNDICIGIPIVNRELKDFENIIGFFINRLPLRTKFDVEGDFISAVNQVKSTIIDAFENKEVSFERIVERIVKTREEKIDSIFQCLFVLNDFQINTDFNINETKFYRLPFRQQYVKHDLTFNVTMGSEEVYFDIEYDSNVFQADSIQLIINRYEKLVSDVVYNKGIMLSDLSLRNEKETGFIKDHLSFRDSKCVQPNKSLPELFNEIVTSFPIRPALKFGTLEFSYEELDSISDSIIVMLNEHGIKKGTLLGLALKNPAYMVISMLASMKGGFPYIPLQPEMPTSRINDIVNDAEINFVIRDYKEWENFFDLGNLKFIDFEKYNEYKGQTIAKIDYNQNDDVYIIYTSGTTGQPKGCIITHANISDYILNLLRNTSIRYCSSFAVVSTLFADLGYTMIFGAWATGGCLHVFEKKEVLNNKSLEDYFQTNSIDCLKITPSHWKALCFDGKILLPKKTIFFGGEELNPEIVQNIIEFNRDLDIYNHYGPTETTIGKLIHKVNNRLFDASYRVPIGRVFSETDILIVNEIGEVVAPGIPGELWIGGRGVGKGYLNRKTLNQEKFIKNCFFNLEEDRFYKTGDKVRLLTTGCIEYLGRIDRQVKIKGYRVELDEIELCIRALTGVKEAFCIYDQTEDQLISFVLGNESFERKEVLNLMKLKLPEYMMPRELIELNEVPLNANGKINYTYLKKYAKKLKGKDNELYLDPITEQISQIWMDLLKIVNIKLDDNFFEIGGHSLLAIRLGAKLKKAFSVDISINDIFHYPSISELSVYISSKIDKIKPSLPLIKRNERSIPLSSHQQRLWFIDKLEGSTNYHLSLAFKTNEELDSKILENAFKQVIDRHEILRTIYKEIKGEVFQEVLPNDTWKVINLNCLEIDKIIKELVQRPFNLANDFPIRVYSIAGPKTETVILTVVHHIAIDGWSVPILFKEISLAYNGIYNNTDPQFNKLPLQYSDYALWQEQYKNDIEYETQLKYWEYNLSNLPPARIFQEQNCGLDKFTEDSLVISNILSSDLHDQITLLAKKEKTTSFVIYLTALYILLHKHSGLNDLCIGIPVTNRKFVEFDDLIGFFVNTLPLRSFLSKEQSIQEYIKLNGQILRNGISHQDIPFEVLVDRFASDRTLNLNPLFQVFFAYEKHQMSFNNITLGNAVMNPIRSNSLNSKFDIAFYISEGEGLKLNVEYNGNKFNTTFVEGLVRHYQNILTTILSNIDLKVDDINIIGLEEEQKITVDYNNTYKDFKDSTIIDHIEYQVDHNPTSVAVIHKNLYYTYEDLELRANSIANFLKRNGVSNESIVGICMDRSFEMVVGILGIMKAGGAYLPLDPAYPCERLKYMIEDSKIEILLTSDEQLNVFENVFINKILVNDVLCETTTISRPERQINSQNLAYVIYTSGSTGKPKGVMNQHDGILNRLLWAKEYFGIKISDRILHKTSISFDVSVWELFLPLISGASIVLADSGGHRDSTYLKNLILESSVTIVHFVPSMLEIFLRESNLGSLERLRTVVCSGEELKLNHVKSFRKIFANKGLYNLYGPTEAAIDVTSWEVPKLLSEKIQKIPIGSPIANTQIYILDEKGNSLPHGITGELYIGGVQVARGYLNKDSITEEKFKKIYIQGEERRLYRTGDMARWIEEGVIEFLGRFDNQVKISGNRVELGEVEQALLSIELIDEAVVNVSIDKNGDGNLIAYLISEVKIEIRDLRNILLSKLPSYMIPHYFIQLDKLPVNENGKVDKTNLPPISNISDVLNNLYSSPRNELEIRLQKVVANELGLDISKIGINDNFFDLGGSSIKLLRIMNKLNNDYDLNLKIIMLFKYPSISALSNYLLSENVPEPSDEGNTDFSDYIDDILNTID
ncbi:amino acid adenylation domain-containing protein [Sphingobacterium kitahiroshimense]|uniref:Amino acid adenylation domain-containing protein n=1 Tax=Sphingobacterium kitahiroshimense TaxID=470446 RepID=A0ABV0BYG4_9SPHI